MIEGEHDSLGNYGQDDVNLPWSSWYYITFGQNVIEGEVNQLRRAFDKKCSEVLESRKIDSPRELGKYLGIPVFSETDAKKWTHVVETHSRQLVRCFKKNRKSIVDLYSSIRSGEYAPNSLGEFICWYVHKAYSSAIEILSSQKVLVIPSSRFQAAVWYKERKYEGLLAGLSK